MKVLCIYVRRLPGGGRVIEPFTILGGRLGRRIALCKQLIARVVRTHLWLNHKPALSTASPTLAPAAGWSTSGNAVGMATLGFGCASPPTYGIAP